MAHSGDHMVITDEMRPMTPYIVRDQETGEEWAMFHENHARQLALQLARQEPEHRLQVIDRHHGNVIFSAGAGAPLS